MIFGIIVHKLCLRIFISTLELKVLCLIFHECIINIFFFFFIKSLLKRAFYHYLCPFQSKPNLIPFSGFEKLFFREQCCTGWFNVQNVSNQVFFKDKKYQMQKRKVQGTLVVNRSSHCPEEDLYTAETHRCPCKTKDFYLPPECLGFLISFFSD